MHPTKFHQALHRRPRLTTSAALICAQFSSWFRRSSRVSRCRRPTRPWLWPSICTQSYPTSSTLSLLKLRLLPRTCQLSLTLLLLLPRFLRAASPAPRFFWSSSCRLREVSSALAQRSSAALRRASLACIEPLGMEILGSGAGRGWGRGCSGVYSGDMVEALDELVLQALALAGEHGCPPRVEVWSICHVRFLRCRLRLSFSL